MVAVEVTKLFDNIPMAPRATTKARFPPFKALVAPIPTSDSDAVLPAAPSLSDPAWLVVSNADGDVALSVDVRVDVVKVSAVEDIVPRAVVDPILEVVEMTTADEDRLLKVVVKFSDVFIPTITMLVDPSISVVEKVERDKSSVVTICEVRLDVRVATVVESKVEVRIGARESVADEVAMTESSVVEAVSDSITDIELSEGLAVGLGKRCFGISELPSSLSLLSKSSRFN
jgi:hypothetical protein